MNSKTVVLHTYIYMGRYAYIYIYVYIHVCADIRMPLYMLLSRFYACSYSLMCSMKPAQEFREFIDRFDSGQLGGWMLRAFI